LYCNYDPLVYISDDFYCVQILVDEELGIDGWNSMENCYAFLYSKEEEGKKKRILMKCLVIGDFLAMDVLDLEAQHKEPFNVQIKYVSVLDAIVLS
jgi:hypothetical protein